MVVVIELMESRPPVGTVGCEGVPAVRFDGWLGLIGAIAKLLDGEDERLARSVADSLDRTNDDARR